MPSCLEDRLDLAQFADQHLTPEGVFDPFFIREFVQPHAASVSHVARESKQGALPITANARAVNQPTSAYSDFLPTTHLTIGHPTTKADAAVPITRVTKVPRS